MIGEHPYVKWAIEVIENYVRNRIIVEPHSNLPEALFKTKAGAFVTIHKKRRLIARLYRYVHASTREPRL